MRKMSERARANDRARSKARYWRLKKERENNPELQEEYRKETSRRYMRYMRVHGDKRREYLKKYYQEHKEYFHEYYKNKRSKNENVSEHHA